MPRRSVEPELSNVYDRLHNLDNDSLQANYLFMKQAPMYVSLEKKYKETKKKNRELKRMIDLLNRQNMELMERCANQRYIETTTECLLSERFSKLPKYETPETIEAEEPVVEIAVVKKENIVYEIVEPDEPIVVEESEVVEEEEVVEEPESEVVEEEEVVEEPESEVVEEEEVVEEPEQEVVEEEEVVEEPEEEEEGVYEITINGTRYYVSNETDSAIYGVAEDDEIGEEIGLFVDGKPTFHTIALEKETSEKETSEEEEEEGVYEITINGTRYYVSNETDSAIYAVAEDDEIGDEVGAFVNGVAKLNP